MFVDEAVIRLGAGRGGDGCVSFHREKYVPRGGPDGGAGGAGGNIYLQGDRRLTTLHDLSLHPHVKAKDGLNGGSNNKNGRGAKDMTLRVPLGTLVRREDGEDTDIIADVLEEAPILIAQGGRGGGGNARFASSKLRLPRFALRGAPGVALKVHLSLKILSDIAIVGLPNSGKSTLLAALTRARPKIADYPFTTLTPNLGVLWAKDSSVVLADIPGLVKDAHVGRGLGNRFLKHIERTRAILILLDATSDVPATFNLLKDEMTHFNQELWRKPRIVAINKLDLKKRAPMKTWIGHIKETAVGVSAKTGLGIEKLMKTIETLWEQQMPAAPEAAPQTMVLDGDSPQAIRGADGFVLVSREWEELASMLPKENSEAMLWFVGKLRADRILRQLHKAGCREGDRVVVGPLEFIYPPQ